MALGDIGSRMFEIPRNEPARQQIIRGEQPPSGPEMPDMGDFDGLQYVEGKTHEFYSKLGALKTLAHKMYTDYGIDVTKPDMTNPQSVAAHNLYMKAQADIYNTANALKNSQKMLQDANKTALGNANVQFIGRQDQGMYTPGQSAVNLGETDIVREANEVAKVYYDQGNANAANDYLTEVGNHLRNQRQELIRRGAPIAQITQKDNEIRMLKESMAMYDPDKAIRRAQAAKEDQPDGRLLKFMNRIANGDMSLLKSHDEYTFKLAQDGSGIQVFDNKKQGRDKQKEHDFIAFGSKDEIPQDFYDRISPYLETHPAYRDFFSKDRLEDDKEQAARTGQEVVHPRSDPNYSKKLRAYERKIWAGEKEEIDLLKNNASNGDISLPVSVVRELTAINSDVKNQSYVTGIEKTRRGFRITVDAGENDKGEPVDETTVLIKNDEEGKKLMREIIEANRRSLNLSPIQDELAKSSSIYEDPEGFGVGTSNLNPLQQRRGVMQGDALPGQLQRTEEEEDIL